jgi:tetratricopeptide (TPR) repeat protein
MASEQKVRAWKEAVMIPTYEPAEPDRNPMFLHRRVYQGSTGKVYPLPFIDRIATEKTDRTWQAVYIENEFLKVMILPEIGGRIHAILDKTNGYDAIYRQEVIKPALVGLAGPWISGGIEFNWPQHHRPSTFMPTDVAIEEHADGSVTVWLSEHEPMNRMKGMHGVCLHPGRSYVQVKARLYNRTPLVQTFLWWANVATKVHEQYQSFFPPDVYCVADHAKRAISTYPLCSDRYYGVDYGGRGKHGVPADEAPRKFQPPAEQYDPSDLSWYANIPVPTSYMCLGSRQDFFGGYDHAAHAGIIHIANHHISPGKKQWTWGNHEFGYAWDRNLSDDDAPYIEIMAGVYTDNQPDFSFLMPGETRTFNQYWYPFQKIGPATAANLDAAMSLVIKDGKVRLGIAATLSLENAIAKLEANGKEIWSRTFNMSPDQPMIETFDLPKNIKKSDLRFSLASADGRVVLAYESTENKPGELPAPATEPPAPTDVKSVDELYIIGTHLRQYRHATRSPEPYWLEALQRDPLDSRCNTALGKLCLYRGQFAQAEEYFRNAIGRLTSRNPNPYDGEAHYHLGLTLRYQGRDQEAYDALYKATWNYAWQAAAFLALAELDCRAKQWQPALEHLDHSLSVNAEQLRARDLKAIVLHKLGKSKDAETLLLDTIKLDPLDFFARWLLAQSLGCDTQIRLDLALDLHHAGFNAEASQLLASPKPEPGSGTEPLLHYYRAYFCEKCGDQAQPKKHFAAASQAHPDYCFPSRLDEILILESAIRSNPDDAHAPYYLGNLFYDRQRFADAIAMWERSTQLNPNFSVAWRNLGIAYFNIANDPRKALAAYDAARKAAPNDARIFYERDQLRKRLGVPVEERLADFEQHLDLVRRRDDLAVELCTLYNLTARPADALEILTARHFQPWEGGEGEAIGQYVHAHLALGREALNSGNVAVAMEHFTQALNPPKNFGEAKHLLANQSDVHYLQGLAAFMDRDEKTARRHLTLAADFKGDFQNMSVRAFSETTFFSALAMRQLDRESEAKTLLQNLLKYADEMAHTPAKIDYFATSLPTLLLFDDDIQYRRQTTAMFLTAQAHLGLGNSAEAQKLFTEVRRRDPSHILAGEFLIASEEHQAINPR